ncbi:MAG: hypothetical protein AMXMBFR84_05730 [Candidatus Hydrogenedentota bacterium]
MATDVNNNVFIADFRNNCVKKFTRDGRFLLSWGELGSSPGQFNKIQCVAVDPSGNVYVSESGNNRIQKFDSNGKLVLEWISSGIESFDHPIDLALDSVGNVYVAHSYSGYVQKFDGQGEFKGTIGSGQIGHPKGIALDRNGNLYVTGERVKVFDSLGVLVKLWGSIGTGDGQFNDPSDVALDSDSNVYILDRNNFRVQKFDSNGGFLSKWGSYGDNIAQFTNPRCITVDRDGFVYVADGDLGPIQKFDRDGQFLASWGSRGNPGGGFYSPEDVTIDKDRNVLVLDTYNARVQKFDPMGRFLFAWGEKGNGNGQFNLPRGIEVNSLNHVYIADTFNHRIQKFDSNGVFMLAFGFEGSGDASFYFPEDIAIDSSDNIYVADTSNFRVQKYNSNGTFLGKWGSEGTGDGQFMTPRGIAVDNQDRVYVCDAFIGRIQVFDAAGNLLSNWGSIGSGPGQLFAARHIAIDDNNRVFVADNGNNRIQVFDPNGQFLTSWGEKGTGPNQFNSPWGVAIDSNGAAYVTDAQNNRLQKFKPVLSNQVAKAIIAAGGGPFLGNNLWEATQSSANYAYRSLAYQGFTKESIHYLSSDTSLDLDENGVADDVSGDCTLVNLQLALTQWAPAQLGELPTGDVVVYLVDHGAPGTFRMNGTEILDVSSLANWLNTLQAGIQGKLTLIYDACESGTFVPQLSSSTFAGKRIVISSTSPGELAYFVNSGTVSFSNYFWTQIFNGLSIREAFDIAKAALGETFDFQTPLLDDNADGQGNGTDDGTLASLSHIGNGIQLFWEGPVIGNVSPIQNLDNTATATLTADPVTDLDGISRVWAVIRPPGFQSTSSSTPVTSLPSVDLLPATGDRWQAEYSGFTTAGTYTIFIYARDRIGNTSAPSKTTVNVTNPLSRKVLILAGGNTASPQWPVFENLGQVAYTSLISQGYNADDIYYLSRTLTQGVDGLAVLDNVRFACTEWATTNTQDFTLYFVGPGALAGFWVNNAELLLWDQLDSWLDVLQDSLEGQVTIVCDADSAGSMLLGLIPATNKPRIIVAGTDAGQSAGYYYGGAISFSKFFWGHVAAGATIAKALDFSAQAMQFASNKQPAIDDNGDGVYNTKTDGGLAGNYYIGNGILVAGDEPLIGTIVEEQHLDSPTAATIWVDQVTSTGSIEQVLALVTPPTGTPVELPLQNLGDGHYESEFTELAESGTYHVSVTAMDTKGQLSMPKSTRIIRIGSVLPDEYETDNTPASAQWIGLDAPYDQHHNFHELGDSDWVQFFAQTGQVVTIETNNLGLEVDTYVELYRPNGSLVTYNDDRETDNRSSCLNWIVDESALFLATVTHAQKSNLTGFGHATLYDLRVWCENGLSAPGSLSIYVANGQGVAIPYAQVSITAQSPVWSAQQQTRMDGTYTFGGLAQGNYVITASASQYVSATSDCPVIAGGTTAQAIVLPAMPGSIQCIIEPIETPINGAFWRVDDGAWLTGGASTAASPGIHIVSFSHVVGWVTPLPLNVTVASGQISKTAGTYSRTVLAIPHNLHASDGMFPDKIRLQWNEVPNATSYRVYRAQTWIGSSAVTLADVTEASFEDFTAEQPAEPFPPGGCGTDGSPDIELAYYIYWVQALGPGNTASDWSDPDIGHRGPSADSVKSDSREVLFEAALPSIPAGNGLRFAKPSDTIAIRLRSEDPIDTDSVWAIARWKSGSTAAARWIPVPNSNATDGWVVLDPEMNWPEEELVEVEAGAKTHSGEALFGTPHTFKIQSSGFTLAQLPELPNAVGDYVVADIGAPAIAAMPVIPNIPNGEMPNLTPFYYIPDGPNTGWHPADQIAGLLQSTDSNGSLQVYHGGIFQWAQSHVTQAQVSPSGAALPANRGVMLVLFAVVLALAFNRCRLARFINRR